jgi:serine/threonine-protein kinase RsbW
VAETKPLAEVTLEIPSRPEYVGVARLAILGVASRMRFSYDEVEDIRLAVGEACTRSIDRLNGGLEAEAHRIILRCLIDSNRLTIEVQNPLVPAPPRPEPLPELGTLVPESDLSGVLIRILMDEVDQEERAADGVQLLRMVKYVAR